MKGQANTSLRYWWTYGLIGALPVPMNLMQPPKLSRTFAKMPGWWKVGSFISTNLFLIPSANLLNSLGTEIKIVTLDTSQSYLIFRVLPLDTLGKWKLTWHLRQHKIGTWLSFVPSNEVREDRKDTCPRSWISNLCVN
jgi:hypothetical protein